MKRSGSVQNKTILSTGACIGLLVLAALAAPFISPYDPLQIDLGAYQRAAGGSPLDGH